MFGLPEFRFRVTSYFTSPGQISAEWVWSYSDPENGGLQVFHRASIIEVRNGQVIRETTYYHPHQQIVWGIDRLSC
jgi:hypothetical protein